MDNFCFLFKRKMADFVIMTIKHSAVGLQRKKEEMPEMFTKLKGSYKCCKQLRCKKKSHAMQNYAVKLLLTSPGTLTM